MENVDWYGIKVLHKSDSKEVLERIEWCKKNSVQFLPQIIKGIIINGKIYTEDELEAMEKPIVIGDYIFTGSDNEELDDDAVNVDISITNDAKIRNPRLAEVGVAFFFQKKDAILFKLKFV